MEQKRSILTLPSAPRNYSPRMYSGAVSRRSAFTMSTPEVGAVTPRHPTKQWVKCVSFQLNQPYLCSTQLEKKKT